MSRSLNLLLLPAVFIVLSLAAGCAGNPKAPPVTPGAIEKAGGDGEVTGTYLIGPGDTLQVFVWRNPEFSATVPVRPDGKISTPLVEDVVAIGKHPSELAREIEEKLMVYIKNPVVTVIVTNFVGQASRQVRVIGEAAQPQAIPFREDLTLLDVMIAVGGLTDFAAGNRAVIVRNQGGKQREFKVRLQDLIKDGKIAANVEMKAGDILIIPRSWF